MTSENIFQTKSSDHVCDGGEISLALLGTRKRYMKLVLILRFCVRVRVLTSLKKAPPDHEVSSSPLSSIHYTQLPPPPASPEQLPETSSSRHEHAVDVDPDNEEQTRLLGSIACIVKERDPCALKRFGGVGKVASVLGSDLDKGIEANEALRERDTAETICKKGFFYHFLNACNRYPILVLLISAGLSIGAETKEQGPRYGWHDGAAILFAVFLLVLFPSVANCIHERKLQKQQNILKIEVTRSGVTCRIPASNLKEGDIVNLKKEDLVPADGLFVKGEDLELDEVLNSKIDGDVNPFLYSGSKVSKGSGSMLVTSVGSNTTLGKDLSLVNQDYNRRTFLETQIEKPNSYAENLGLFVSVLILLVVLIRLLCKRQQENDDVPPELKGNTTADVLIKIVQSALLRPRGRVRILAAALTVLVIGIQHAMPFAITVSLSFWNEKVESLGLKPRNLSACGTTGLVTVICINITGGFMCDKVEVKNFFIGEKDVNNDMDSETDQAVIETLCQGIGASTCVPGHSVSPVNGLADWAKSRRVHDYSRLGSNNNGSLVLLTKEGDDKNSVHRHLEGSASMILNLCSHYYDCKGEVHAIEGQMRNFEHVIRDMEKRGLRAIAFACKKTDISNVTEDEMHLLAIVGLKYSCSEEIKLTMKDVKEAGVCIKLVSGDEVSIARAIAHELGIIQHGLNDQNFEGQQFRGLDASAQMEKIEQITVIGSCLSEDMLLVAESLQRNGHIVAFFGGSSVIDIPALKEADVGITMETWSTELAREGSDIVIPNKRSLCEVMQIGRCLYHNIQKFTELQLTACISGLLINLGAAMCSWDSPLTMIQLFWVNSVMCLLGALMMVMDLKNHEIQADTPAMRTQPLVTGVIWKHILIQAFYQASVLLISHLVGLAIPSMTEDVWKSFVFNSFMVCQLFNLFKAMNIFKKEVMQILLPHYWFWVSAVAVLVMQVLFVEFAKSLAASARLNAVHWAISFVIAAFPWITECAFGIISASFADYLQHSDGSRRTRWPLSYVSFWGIPVFALFIFSVSYYFNPGTAITFR